LARCKGVYLDYALAEALFPATLAPISFFDGLPRQLPLHDLLLCEGYRLKLYTSGSDRASSSQAFVPVRSRVFTFKMGNRSVSRRRR